MRVNGLLLVLLVLLLQSGVPQLHAVELDLHMLDLQWGDISIDELRLKYQSAEPDRISHQHPAATGNGRRPVWQLTITRLDYAHAAALDLSLKCLDAGRQDTATASRQTADGLPDCRHGMVVITPYPSAGQPQPAAAMAAISGSFAWRAGTGSAELRLPGLAFKLENAVAWELALQELPLAWVSAWMDLQALAALPESLAAALPWPRGGHISGVIKGQLVAGQLGADGQTPAGSLNSLQADVQVQALDYDNAAGNLAAAGLDLAVNINIASQADGRWQYSGKFDWSAGEWLFGSFYLPPPVQPVVLSLHGGWLPATADTAGELHLDDLRWRHDQAVNMRAQAQWVLPASARQYAQTEAGSLGKLLPRQWSVSRLEIELPAWQDAYLNGWLQTLGMQDLISAGQLRLQSTGALSDGGIQHATRLQLDGLTLAQADGRFAVDDLDADINWHIPARIAPPASAPANSTISWQELRINKLPLAATRLDFVLQDQQLRLQRDAMLPLLDGGLLLHELNFTQFLSADSNLNLDAELLPVSLQQLGQVMGWPEFGGQLSGTIPGISLEHGIWKLNGQLDLQVFAGNVNISDLSIERPFGVLPALNASISIDRLQLEPLTEAFDVGRITGPIDGYVKELRLLNWRPVSFDAWLRSSPEPKVKLRISQRAVDTLSSVGGGIGGGMQATLLRLFKSFRYSKLGIACKLSNGVCAMQGVEDIEDGHGFVLIKGAGIPRLDVVAYNKNVDWQRLLTQLQAAIKSQEVSP